MRITTTQYRKPVESREGGFTLVEIISVLVISAILATGIVRYINQASLGITRATNINQIASAGRMAINRLTAELHNALPNSIRTSTAQANGDQCIEFVPIRALTSYLNPSFFFGGSSSFDVVDFVPTLDGTTDGYAVIYPRRQADLYGGDNGTIYADWPDFPNRGPINEITNITDNAVDDTSTVTLVESHRFSRRSPNERFFVVDQPVSYCVKDDKLYRYTDYGSFETQVTEEESGSCAVSPDPPDRCLPNYAAGPTRKKWLITDSIDNTGLTAFSVSNQSLRRNAVIAIVFNMSANNESLQLNHEVLTRALP